MLYKWKLLLFLFFSLSSPLLLPYEKLTAEILTLNKKEHIQLFGNAEKIVEPKMYRVVRDSIKHTAYDIVQISEP